MRRLAWGLAALALVMLIGGEIVLLATAEARYDAKVFAQAVLEGVLVAVVAAFAVIGALVISRRSHHAIGWICVAAGLAAGLANVAEAYVNLRLRGGSDPGPLAGVAAVYGEASWLGFVVVPITFVMLLFPDGRLPSPRWRRVAWAAGVGIGVTFLSVALAELPDPPSPLLENPFSVDGSLSDVLSVVGQLLIAIGVFGSVTALVVRYRRAPHRQRLQIKWLALAGAVIVVVVPIDAALGDSLGDWAYAATLLSLTGLPVAIGIAILRHRLYDIDVVINRALVYFTLTASAAASYVAGVLVLQLALSPLTRSSDLAIAGSTLAVAALFQPARRRIQALVDRRFFRRRYDAQRTLERFGAQLRDEVDLDELGDELCAVVAETMAPEHVTLWLREGVR